MNERATEQLDKILALADSSHDGEAVVAVRKARQILSRDGLCFGDLARAASTRQNNARSPGVFSFLTGQRDQLESQMTILRQQYAEMQEQMQTQELQLDFWKRRALDLEQSATHAQTEAERWKALARDTAERLWDIGNGIRNDEPPMAVSEPALAHTANKK